MNKVDLCYLPAQKAISLFRSKKLSPVDLMKAIIARAEEVEPKINAFSFTYFDEALELAKKAEQAYVNGTERPLEGIPFAVKDESYIAGKPTSNGSLLLQDFVPDVTSAIVQRVLNAGAIVHARTTTPEFSAAVFTWSKLWGVSRNPWNLEITPGGSTGGGAASLAAGTTTLINGSDIGGSIRVPASMCGVVGYKAPFGRNPEDHPWNLEQYTHSGPLARNINDTILLQNLMCGPHPHDIVSLKPKLTLPSSYESIKGKKISYSFDLGYQPLDPEIKQLMVTALQRFEALGAEITEIDLGWDWETLDAAINRLSYGLMGASLEEMMCIDAEQMTSYTRWLADKGNAVSRQVFMRAEALAGEMFVKLADRAFADHDLFICPTVALPGVPADFDYSQSQLSINGEQVDGKFGWVMTYPFNMLSRCPVLNIPVGRASNNVPIGLQLVAPPYEDEVAFQFGWAYERSFDNTAVSPFISSTNYPEI